MAETETVEAPVGSPGLPGATIEQQPAIPTWRDSLPEPLRAEKSLQDFKDVGDLAKSYVETKRLVGAKVAPPAPDAPPEVQAAFRKAMGVPDTPEGYQAGYQRPEIALQSWDAKAEQGFFAAAHAVGMTPAQAHEAIKYYGKFEAEKLAAAQERAVAAMTALREEWGLNYDSRIGRAVRAVKAFGGDEMLTLLQTPVEQLTGTRLGAIPALVRMFDAIAAETGESDAMISVGDLGTSAEDAKAKLQEIYADKKHPYNNPGAAGWQEAADEVLALRRIALGSENRKLVEYR